MILKIKMRRPHFGHYTKLKTTSAEDKMREKDKFQISKKYIYVEILEPEKFTHSFQFQMKTFP